MQGGCIKREKMKYFSQGVAGLKEKFASSA
jgi:hypothetical protein